MDQAALESFISKTFEDERLDSSERQQLREQTDALSAEQLRFVRNRAFTVIREKLSGNDELLSSLKWLEQVVKTLDQQMPQPSKSTVYFSPGDQCWRRIVEFCQQAKNQLDICVFTISDDRITDAILKAHERGVAVRIITDNDKTQDAGSDIDYLISKGVPVVVDHSSYHMHHKFSLADQHRLLNGSFNWTRSASEYNEENFTIEDNAPLAASFQEQFDKLWKQFR